MLYAITEWLKSEEDVSIPIGNIDLIKKEFRQELTALLFLPAFDEKLKNSKSKNVKIALRELQFGPFDIPPVLTGYPPVWFILISFVILNSIRKLLENDVSMDQCLEWIQQWRLIRQLRNSLASASRDEWFSSRYSQLAVILLDSINWINPQLPLADQDQVTNFIDNGFTNPAFRQFVNVKEFDQVLWFNKELSEEFAWWSCLVLTWKMSIEHPENNETQILDCFNFYQYLLIAIHSSDYRVDNLVVE